MIRTHLDQCAYKTPGGESFGRFNQVNFLAETIEEALEKLKEEYDIVPSKKPRGVFIDTNEGTKQVGFIHSRWANNGEPKSYWEENWISFQEEHRKIATLPKKLRAKH